MAHKEQRDFLIRVKNKFPHRFINCNVLDIGSLDINGNNRFLFDSYKYTGIDIGSGPNVDIVCYGHLFDPNEYFDIVISTECLEHDKFYDKTIINAIRLTKNNGMFIFTCASSGRKEHGTIDNESWASPYTNDYYKNLTERDIRDILDIDNIFLEYSFEFNSQSSDLYFYGIKND